MLVQKTRYKGRRMLAVESLLEITGSKQVTADNANLNAITNAWSVVFLIVPRGNWQLSKGSFSISQADLSLTNNGHYQVCFTSDGNYYVNTQLKGTHAKTWSPSGSLALSGNMLINHVVFFNRVVSPAELQHMHRWGGLVPKSAHASCIGHYIAYRSGRIMWDMVLQYNDARIAAGQPALAPYHAQMVSYSDSEVGLPNTTTQVSYKDFYNKQRLVWWRDENETPLIEKQSLLPALRKEIEFNGINQYLRVSNFNPTKEKGYTIGITYRLDKDDIFFGSSGLITKRDFNYTLIHGYNGMKAVSFWTGNGQNFPIGINGEISDHSKNIQVVYTIFPPQPDNLNRSVVDAYINGEFVVRHTNILVTGYDEINADLQIGFDNGHYLKGSISHAMIAKGIATRKQVKALWNNGRLSNPDTRWTNLEPVLLPDLNSIYEQNGQFYVRDNSPFQHTIQAVNYNVRDAQPDNALSAVKLIDYKRGYFYELINKGLKGYAGTTHRLLSTDQLNLGNGTQSFSLRYWMHFQEVGINRILFDNDIVDPRFTLLTGGIDGNNVVAQYAFKVGNRDTIVSNSIAAGHKLESNKQYLLGFDRISNDALNWKYAYNNILSSAWTVDFNNMQESDVLTISNPSYLGARFFVSNQGVNAVFTMFAVFMPALSETQSMWLYNTGEGNDPASLEARAMGIGVQGIDVVGQNGITTLLTRYLTFDKLFNQSGNEYIREHVTNNNRYTQLTGYLTTDSKIIYI